MRARPALGLLLALGACAAPGAPPVPTLTLPAPPMVGAGSPERATVFLAADAFAHPSRLQGNPGAAALAVARLEWLAEEGPRVVPEAAAIIGPSLALGRAEARAALGIPAQASPATVLAALEGALRPLGANDRAGAAAALAPIGGALVLDRLGALPPLPRAGAATQALAVETGRTRPEDVE